MKRNFVPVFLFLRFAENMSRYWGAFSGFTKFRRPERTPLSACGTQRFSGTPGESAGICANDCRGGRLCPPGRTH